MAGTVVILTVFLVLAVVGQLCGYSKSLTQTMKGGE